MKGKTVIGALLVSVALCGQGFGFELLDRILGLNCGGCGDCNGCCAKVACCDPVKCCAPEPACCEKACCDPVCGKKPCCCEPCCCEPCCTPVRDLFCGVKGLFECKKCCKVNCCCEPKCCDPVCCKKPACCDPVCCAKPACCDPVCCQKPCCCKKCRPILCLVDDLFNCKKCCCKKSCNTGCDPGCCDPCGSGGAKAQDTKPANGGEASEETTQLPKAPSPDPKASLLRSRGVYNASRSAVVRN